MARLSLNRKSGFIQRGGVMRRESLWIADPFTTTGLTASATAALVSSLSAGTLDLRPFTVVRTRGVWKTRSDQSAASETYIGNLGFCVVTDQAIAVGVSACPTPATEQFSDAWFMIEQWIGRFELVGTAIQENTVSRPFDSRAMRKVEDGFDIGILVEAGIGGSGCIVEQTGRMLLKLH